METEEVNKNLLSQINSMTADQRVALVNAINQLVYPLESTDDCETFIREVVNNKNYSIKFEPSSDLYTQYTQHILFENAIEELGGCYSDKSKHKDEKAIQLLYAADELVDEEGFYLDQKLEALCSFMICSAKKVDKIRQALGSNIVELKGVNTEEVLFKTIYKCLSELEKDFLENHNNTYFITADDANTTKTLERSCYDGWIKCTLWTYSDTYEVGVEISVGESYSSSYDWSDKAKARANAKLSPAIANSVVQARPLFATSPFWEELDKEIAILREFWGDGPVESFKKRDDMYLLNGNLPEYLPFDSIIQFIADFFTYNDLECSINSKGIFDGFIRPYYHDDMYWPQTVDYGKSDWIMYDGKEYFVSVINDKTEKLDHTTILVYGNDTKMFVDCITENAY